MGNKQAKALCEVINKGAPSETTLDLTFAALCERPIMSFLKERQVDKTFKPADILTFASEMHFNIPKDLGTEERETRKKRYREMLHRSILVAGHEKYPQVDSTIEALEEPPEQKLPTTLNYTSSLSKEFMVFLVLLRGLLEKSKLTPPFEQKLAECIKLSPGGAEGASAALGLSSLLLDPKQVQENTQVVDQALALFRDIPTLALYGWTRQALSVERAIGKIKSCLIDLIEGSGDIGLVKNTVLALAYIGLATGSIEDLLLAIRYVNQKHLEYLPHIIDEIIERIIKIEDIDKYLDSLSLDSDGIKERVPFESMYMQMRKDEYEGMSSATDGEYVYVYSPGYGILSLGAGKNKIHGKLYASFTPDQAQLRLLCINRALYAATRTELFKVSTQTGKLKPTKKTACIPKNGKFLLSSTGKYIVVYKEIPLENPETVQAEVIYYDSKTKMEHRKYLLEHNLNEVQEIVSSGEIILLLGPDKYWIYDLSRSIKIKEGKSDILQKATVCSNSENGDLYIIFLKDPKEGLEFGKLSSTWLPTQDNMLEKPLQCVEQNNKKEVSALLGFHVPPSDQQPHTEKDGPADHLSQWNKLLAILTKRTKVSANAAKNLPLDKPDQVFKAFKAPLGVHLSGKCIEILLKLLEHFSAGVRKEEKIENSTLLNVVTLLNSHVQAMQTCELTLKECAGPVAVQEFRACLKNVVKEMVALKGKLKGDTNLTESFVLECEALLRNSAVVFLDDHTKALEMIADTIQAAIDGKETSDLAEKIASAATWANMKKNQIRTASKLFEENNKIVLKLLATYFSLEEAYLAEKIHEFLNKKAYHHLQLLGFVKEELSFGIRAILDHALVIYL